MKFPSPSIYFLIITCLHLKLHNAYKTKLAFPISFRFVSQNTNTHTGIGTLRNETERDIFNIFT